MNIDPKDRKIQDGELTDEQTEQVAGGASTGGSTDEAQITQDDFRTFRDDSNLG
jgi:hypothetical protein